MPIRGEGLMDEDQDDAEEEDKLTYVLHPNCAIEEV